MRPLTIGFIGGGETSAVGKTHLAAARMDGHWRVGPAMFSHLEEENRASHAFYGLEFSRHYASLKEFLDAERTKFDLVALLTPSPDHADQLLTLIEAGVPTLVEKPIACTPAEADRIETALAGSPQAYVRFVHNYSAYPMVRELMLRRWEGAIGEVRDIRISVPSDVFAREALIGPPQPWRQADPEIPMLLLDLGTHAYHLERCILPPSPARVAARMRRTANSFGVVDAAEIWVDRADGVGVSYWLSKSHLGFKNGLTIEVYGKDGALRWVQEDPDHFVVSDMQSARKLVTRGEIRPDLASGDRFKAGHPTGFVEAFGYFYRDLAEDFRAFQKGEDGVSWMSGPDEAIDGIRFLNAASAAERTSTWVSL
ncbi:oxidoreductase [Roseibium aquae]|uniref:Oxidoreductase n=1 Tax=Roseibium aquae TaxID=1323746 RepID=A0A916TIJ4_9HYPH|nr:Gfo/Idh/MocA family oxidoreductase [Roseibium aquae]GGB45687.1 oxidoreductase [Roseibium aquae]